MESTTLINNLKVSPKKLRFLITEIKKMTPTQALTILRYTPKKGARIFYKAISSALSNAKNTLKATENLLKFKALLVDEGLKIKRWRAGGRGTAKMFRRRSSRIKIVLEAEKQNKLKNKI